MGNSVLDGRLAAPVRSVAVTKFYTSAAWIEGRAEDQLAYVAGWPGVREIAAFPDLHPGKYGPVGCAVLADRIYPQLVGGDIGCGMSLFQLDLPARRFKPDKSARRMRVLGDAAGVDYNGRLEQAGLPRGLFAEALGTIGGGNHFCEVQQVADCKAGYGMEVNSLYLLVHSGSRGLGNAALTALPQGAFDGLDPAGKFGRDYLRDHDQAVKWARLNRRIIAERAAAALRCDLQAVADAPHNLLAPHDGGWLHRKGAAQTGKGLVPLAGSRATPSYLVHPLGANGALQSTAHGAGRRYDRSSMRGRVRAKRSDLTAMQQNAYGGRIICEDRDLLIEEAPHAYKSAKSVVADLVETGVVQKIAMLHPLLTFKKTRQKGEER
jgi:release factor H-coupled RctB family protein